MNALRGILVLEADLVAKTGLRVGAGQEEYEIGGLDNPIIRDPITEEPYLPGSSLKGRLRSLLEWSEGKVSTGSLYHTCNDPTCPVCRVFGRPADEREETWKYGPTRLIVRDAFLDDESKKKLAELPLGAEIKTENTISRISGKSQNLRSVERVPAGTTFEISMAYSFYEIQGDIKTDISHLRYLFTAMRLLEDSYLGGMGSRGYGRVEFKEFKFILRTKEDYVKGSAGTRYPREFDLNDEQSVEQLIRWVENRLSGSSS